MYWYYLQKKKRKKLRQVLTFKVLSVLFLEKKKTFLFCFDLINLLIVIM